MKKVYFNIRTTSRERMWDTIKYSGEICDAILPHDVIQQSSIKTFANSNNIMSKIKYEISKKIINKQTIDKNIVKSADLIYIWGACPRDNFDKDYIIELDNPYALSYYHTQNFHNNSEKIKKILKKAYKITYLSEASKNNAIELFGDDIIDKSFVNYPYMNENFKKRVEDSNSIIHFVFVGLNGKYKGGYELLEAFHNVKKDNIKLTFVSDLSKTMREKYSCDKRMVLLDPQPREYLLDILYPSMDIMIFPSFYESFGVVLLEAMSFGAGIISTNTYATPEILKDGINGRLLHHPILRPKMLGKQETIVCVEQRAEEFYRKYLQNNEFYYGLYSELKNAIVEATNNYKQWQENSIKLFNQKFAPKIWLENFKKIIK